MIREIKFRGLNAQGEMVYGDLSYDLPNSTDYYDEYPARICWHEGQASCNQPVKKGTVGQYTGLKDVNGVEIYETDIVEYKFPETPNCTGETVIATIEYVDDVASFRAVNDWDGESPIHEDIRIKVVGNIYQNPELMDVEK